MRVFRRFLFVVLLAVIVLGIYLINQQMSDFDNKYALLKDQLYAAEVSLNNVPVETVDSVVDDGVSIVDFRKAQLSRAEEVLSNCVTIQNDINDNILAYHACEDPDEASKLMDKWVELYNKMWDYTNLDNLVMAWFDIDPLLDSVKNLKWSGNVGQFVNGNSVSLFFFLKDESVDDLLCCLYAEYDYASDKIISSNRYFTGYSEDYSYKMHGDYDENDIYSESYVEDDVNGEDHEFDDFLQSVKDLMNAPVPENWSNEPMDAEESHAYSDLLNNRLPDPEPEL